MRMEYYPATRNNSELYHYGVLGMKWGRHKARVYDQKASKARKRGNTDAAEKYEYKAQHKRNVVATKHDINRFSNRRSIGHRIATNLIGGMYANRTYNAVRMAGGSRAAALGATAGASLLGGPLGHIVVSSLIVSDIADKRGN